MVNVETYSIHGAYGNGLIFEANSSQTEGSEKRGFIQNSGATDDAPMGMYYSQ